MLALLQPLCLHLFPELLLKLLLSKLSQLFGVCVRFRLNIAPVGDKEGIYWRKGG